MVKNLSSGLLEHADLLEQAMSLPGLVKRQGTCFPGAVCAAWVDLVLPCRATKANQLPNSYTEDFGPT